MLKNKALNLKVLFSGLITGLSISFAYLMPFYFLGYYIFLSNITNNNQFKQNFILGWIFGFGFFLGSMHWIINPFLVYDKHLPIAPFILIIFPTMMAFFFAIPCILVTRLIKERKFCIDYFWCKCFLISFYFFAFEYLRSILFGGLPLNLSGHIWAFNERFISIVSYVGVFGLTFITIYWIVIVCSLFKLKKKISILPLVIIPTLLFSIPVSGENNLGNLDKIKIRVVQPNINQKDKWNRLLFQDHIEKLLSLSDNDEKDIVLVWPEVAITAYLNENKELVDYLKKKLGSNKVLITGALRREIKDNEFKIYNSIYLFQDRKVISYEKRRLVPFGEFIPLKSILDLLKITPGETDFSKGEKARLMSFEYDERKISFEPSICYEAIFQTSNDKEISLLINITNDAWFGKTTGPKQHLAASIFRSVEKGVPLIRSANSGISVITDKTGQIVKRLDLNQTGFIDFEVITQKNSTFFSENKKKSIFLLISLIFLFNLITDLIIKNKKRFDKYKILK